MITLPNDILFEEVERAIAAGRTARIALRGDSMYPTLREGRDSVLLRPFDLGELRRGDVALFRHCGRHRLHRLIGRDGEYYIFRGDGLVYSSERVLAGDIVALMEYAEASSGLSISRRSIRWRLFFRLWMALTPLRSLIIGALRR